VALCRASGAADTAAAADTPAPEFGRRGLLADGARAPCPRRCRDERSEEATACTSPRERSDRDAPAARSAACTKAQGYSVVRSAAIAMCAPSGQRGLAAANCHEVAPAEDQTPHEPELSGLGPREGRRPEWPIATSRRTPRPEAKAGLRGRLRVRSSMCDEPLKLRGG
jgi:hypothetical protein